jgi:uncharacterized phage protein (TIGR01671 family)
MREIKFRAWDKAKKEFVPEHWFLSLWNDGSGCFRNSHNVDSRIDLDDLILMQFTGLIDKNGKEIFEGDIISGGGKEPDYIVEFSDGCFRGNEINGWDVMVNHFPLSQSVTISEPIIGNVYENPELVK